MTTRLAFTIPGKPISKGRPRFTVRNGFATVYTPAKTREGEAAIAKIAKVVMRGVAPATGAVKLRILFVFAPPASWSKQMRELAAAGHVIHTSKPDADNCAKAILDALNGIAWADDCLITDVIMSKRYGAAPRTDVVIEPVDMTGKVLAPGPERTAKKARANPFDRPVTRDLFVGKGK